MVRCNTSVDNALKLHNGFAFTLGALTISSKAHIGREQLGIWSFIDEA